MACAGQTMRTPRWISARRAEITMARDSSADTVSHTVTAVNCVEWRLHDGDLTLLRFA